MKDPAPNSQANGTRYWRSLEELSSTKEFQEFPIPEGMSRRKFLSLMGASLALAGLAGCRRPVEKIIPYVIPPENFIPGNPRFYATNVPQGISAVGVLVETHEGRPTKIEGNPQHPFSQGATNAFIQAEILNLYDPDRSRQVLYQGAPSSWDNFLTTWKNLYTQYRLINGKGLAILSTSFSSPTLARLKEHFHRTFPAAQWATYDPISDENIYKGLERITGQRILPLPQFHKTDIILSFDSDFLHMETHDIAAAKGFAKKRKLTSEKDDMNRLYMVEPSFSVTGGMADHRLSVPSKDIPQFALALVKALAELDCKAPGWEAWPDPDQTRFDAEWIEAVARDLLSHRGSSVVVAGRRQPEWVHALVYTLNEALNNHGKTCLYYRPHHAALPDQNDLIKLVQTIQDGHISTLIILGGNPAYNTPADLDLARLLPTVPTTIHLGLHHNETGRLATWHIPQAHFMESWGDVAALDGTLGVVQPQIAPLLSGRSITEVLGSLVKGQSIKDYDLVRETWKTFLNAGDFEGQWQQVLHDGVHGTGSKRPARVSVKKSALQRAQRTVLPGSTGPLSTNNLEIVFAASRSVYDGSYANNTWLQELPDPVTKLTWDNAALMSRRTAETLNATSEDLITLSYRGRSLTMPVWIVPGQADFSITVALGYGHTAGGNVSSGVGFNTYQLRTSLAPDTDQGLIISKAEGTYPLASTQDHHGMDLETLAANTIQKRLPTLLREATLQEYQENPDFVDTFEDHPPLRSLWEERSYDEGNQWGMVIDLNQCTGCNACTLACQSENNIPVVGKEEVTNGREMHWIRVDRYFRGEEEAPDMVYQPVSCQHCENAPCEQVCPVAATLHDKEGLNVMVYNRCVGTRYCANNCPYKVRRFNFYNYTKAMSELVQMAMNPDVTVRSRGVMEKCTFCIQRISRARIQAKEEHREIEDGEVVAACQQVCPTEAIIFGNLNDPNSNVTQIKKQNRNYALLGELNTKPRLTYLARIRNPNPELAPVSLIDPESHL